MELPSNTCRDSPSLLLALPLSPLSLQEEEKEEEKRQEQSSTDSASSSYRYHWKVDYRERDVIQEFMSRQNNDDNDVRTNKNGGGSGRRGGGGMKKKRLLLSSSLSSPMEVCCLAIGDIEIVRTQTTGASSEEEEEEKEGGERGSFSLSLMIERKTWRDLEASVRDGRFREQRARLSQWKSSEDRVHRRSVLFVIEGSSSSSRNSFPIAHKALRRLYFVHGFPVYFTNHVADTCDLVEWIATDDQLSSLSSLFPDPSSSSHPPSSDTTTTTTTTKTTTTALQECHLQSSVPRKRDIQSSSTLLAVALYSIHGISKEIALAIAAEFSSLYVFCLEYHKDPAGFSKRLAEWPLSGVSSSKSSEEKEGGDGDRPSSRKNSCGGGRRRRPSVLGPHKSRRIIEFITGMKEEEDLKEGGGGGGEDLLRSIPVNDGGRQVVGRAISDDEGRDADGSAPGFREHG